MRRGLTVSVPLVAIVTAIVSVIPVATMAPVCGAGESGWVVTGRTGSVEITQEPVADGDSVMQRFHLRNSGPVQQIRIVSAQLPSRIHDEFTASVRIQCNAAGILSGLSVVLPHQTDPRTKQPLTTTLRGDVSRFSDRPQILTVTGTPNGLQSQLRRVRAEIHQSDLDATDAYLDGIELLVEVAESEIFLDVGEVTYGPVVTPTVVVPDSSATAAAAPPAAFVPLRAALNTITLNRRPAILRFAPDHGERETFLRDLGLNAVWLESLEQGDRAALIAHAGMAVLATPPHPDFDPRDFSRPLSVLPPLDQYCPQASAWMMGTRVGSDDLAHLLAWSREVRSADRRSERIQMVDVTAAEGAVSREIELVGIGRHVVGRPVSFGELRNELYRRQRIAGQLTTPWIWIQTEPSTDQRLRSTYGLSHAAHVEPEQITQQVNAAISAGFKGVGFWKSRTLEDADELRAETALAIELSCMELQLLEPLLANGRVDGHLRLASPEDSNGRARRPGASPPSLLQQALGGEATSTASVTGVRPVGPDATVISTGNNTLLLASWWDETSQYVPAAMYAESLSLTVAPPSETAAAYYVTPTGIRGLPRNVMAGGLQLPLKDFCQHAWIVVTSDRTLIQQLQQETLRVAPRAAAIQTELATRKLARVKRTTERIREFHSLPTQAAAMLSAAHGWTERARQDVQNERWQNASASAAQALWRIRSVQHSCWLDATRDLEDPMTSVYTGSFETLPEHWSLMQQRAGRIPAGGESLLASGSFDNLRLLSEGGWQRSATTTASWSCMADVVSEPGAGNSVLRLAAWQQSSNPADSPAPAMTPLVVSSPEVSVAAGDILEITGRYRRGRNIASIRPDTVVVFDSLSGAESGIRLTPDREWRTFRLIRRADEDATLHLSLAVTDVSEVQLDDVQIVRLPARTSPLMSPVP